MTDLGSAQKDRDDAVLDAAADWRIRLDAPGWSAADEAALEDWLAVDPAHAKAFADTEQVWGFFDEHAVAPEMMRARRDAIDRAQRTAGRRWSTPGGPPVARLAAGLAVAVVLGAGLYPLVDGATAYQTGMGERRVVTLRDGSKLSLDASSRVTVDYSKDARRLKLVRGQARFDVAKDVTRPFSVAARDRTVVATGTAFNIDMLDPEVRVTLIEGKVVILPRTATALLARPKARGGSVELHSGQQLVSTGRAAPTVAAADLTETTAWQLGKIIFDNEPLAEAVERVNRYSNRRIVVADEAARTTRVSGVFDAGDTSAFVGAVTYYLPIKAVEQSDEIVLTGDRGA